MVGPQSLLELDEERLEPEEDDELSPDLLELSGGFGFGLRFSFPLALAVGFGFGSPFALPFALGFAVAEAAAAGPPAAAPSNSTSVFTSPGGCATNFWASITAAGGISAGRNGILIWARWRSYRLA